MNWESFYLVCFVVGLMLSVLSLLGGMGHLGWHIHVPHAPHLPTVGHLPHGMPHAGHIPAGRRDADAAGRHHGAMVECVFDHGVPLLVWRGGLSSHAPRELCRRRGAGALGAFGLVGGALVFLFLTKVLLPHERELTADETAVIGAVGRVSAPIRAAGTGEIVYEQLGARRSAPARSEDGMAIPATEEVFVVRYEKGIAYVRRWEELDRD